MDFHDWELEGVNELVDLIYSRKHSEGSEDFMESGWERAA